MTATAPPAKDRHDDQGRQLGLSATVSRTDLIEKLKLCCIPKPLRRMTFGALLEARRDSLAIATDNYEVRLCVEMPGTIESEGAITLSPQRFSRILQNADGDVVVILANDGNLLEVRCGGISANLACGSPSDFPQRAAEPVAATFELPDLRAVLEWLSPVINDDSRHEGIHLSGDGQMLRVEAVDGKQLHCVSFESSAVVNAIAPANLIKLVKVFEADAGCTAEVTARSISFRTGKILVCT